jgi:hypothetical protein
MARNKSDLWSFRYQDNTKERVKKEEVFNQQLDTLPPSNHNQFVFGKTIRDIARDRSKDVSDIRDMKHLKMTFKKGTIHAET